MSPSRAHGFIERFLLATALGVASLASLPSEALAQQACPVACDGACSTCCRRWRVRAVCASGAVTLDGDHRSFDEAQMALERRRGCAQDPASCNGAVSPCGGAPASAFEVFCEDKDRLAPPGDTDASRVLAEASRAIAASTQDLEAVSRDLVEFGRARIVRDKGAGRLAEAADRVRTERRRLRVLAAEGARLTTVATSVDDARAYSARASAASRAATESSAALRAAMNDPATVDTAMEERERRAAEAVRAREAEQEKRRAAAAEAARAREAEQEKRRAAAALEREAAAQQARERAERNNLARDKAQADRAASEEAARRKGEDAKAASAAAARASDASTKTLVSEKQASAATTLAELDARLSTALAATSATLAIKNLSGEERARAQATDKKLRGARARVADLRTRNQNIAQTVASRPSAEALSSVRRVETELATVAAEVTALSASSAPTTPARSDREPAPVPACLLDVTAPAEGAMVSIDGAKPVSLPAKVRLSSGQHAFTVTVGSLSARQSELVVCGRTSSIALRAPK